jgi:hypothetical protein
MVSARCGHDTCWRNVPGEKRIERTSRLERASVLGVLQLEDYPRSDAEVLAAQLENRSTADLAGKTLGCGLQIAGAGHQSRRRSHVGMLTVTYRTTWTVKFEVDPALIALWTSASCTVSG